MTSQQRIESLQDFGYNEREAAFLTLAALHSGYFVRRQYNRFAGCKHGTTVIQLVERTAANRHTRTTVFPNNTGVYHLYSRPFYQALGDPNNRNRRRRSPLAVKTKLMALDFVLANPNLTYLATEREKVDYFINQRKVLTDLLPKKIYSSKLSDAATVRHFVDKFPVFISSVNSASPPVVSFCYIDAGARSLAGFRTFLEQYSQLFRQLGRFRLFYIAGTDRHFEAAERQLKARVQLLNSDESLDSYASKILEYFRLEHLYQAQQFHSLTRAKLIRLKRARREFTGPEIQSLFELWKRDGDRVITEKMQKERACSMPVEADFRTHRLEYSYEYLETFARH